jgi:hypothetical protein
VIICFKAAFVCKLPFAFLYLGQPPQAMQDLLDVYALRIGI